MATFSFVKNHSVCIEVSFVAARAPDLEIRAEAALDCRAAAQTCSLPFAFVESCRLRSPLVVSLIESQPVPMESLRMNLAQCEYPNSPVTSRHPLALWRSPRVLLTRGHPLAHSCSRSRLAGPRELTIAIPPLHLLPHRQIQTHQD